MTQEDKELLLKDLCARLSYGVKGIITYDDDKNIFTIKGIFNILFLSDTECCHIEDFKPYLRPMSSMTEEEKKEISILLNYEFYIDDDYALVAEDNRHRIRLDLMQIYIDYLNAHHFDYCGLIERGLALEATEGMYN